MIPRASLFQDAAVKNRAALKFRNVGFCSDSGVGWKVLECDDKVCFVVRTAEAKDPSWKATRSAISAAATDEIQ